MHAVIAAKRGDLAGLCRRHGVARLEVFGSAARETDFDPARSDADFLVEFTPAARAGFEAVLDLKTVLERLLSRPVDVVELRVIENPYILAGINRSRELVYAA